ncbi:ABC transporter permease [Rhizobium mayense]|uniref:ABC transporter permease subunit n=1 Tax=Rhizobium mayense TaxID=1312184 RepID=A0ABT7JRD8_9HYPH|nr:ABC transporter permease subunit [Rhizobium mayense]MDL2398916.1 ABC transporter permease subunit [Rhizobium mayense]
MTLGQIRLLVVVLCVVALEVICRTGLISDYTLIPPSEMAVALFQLLRDGSLTGEIVATLSAVLIAIVGAIIFGILGAVVLHALPRLRRAIDPVLSIYYSIPMFVFYPLFIVIFGLTDTPKVLLGFLLAVVTMIASTLNGLDRVPKVMRKTARIFKLSKWGTVWHIILPSAAPHIFNGVKLAIAQAFVGVLGAEFILSTGGLGYQIFYAFHDFDNRTMYAIVLLVLIIVSIVNAVLLGWERRLRQRRGLA